jgi:biofilm PGA synthesis lipoprotein PgaB
MRTSQGRRRRNLRRLLFVSLLVLLAFGCGALGTILGWRYRAHRRPSPLAGIVQGVSTAASNVLSSLDTTAGSDTPGLLTAGTQPIPVIMYHDVVPRKQVWFDLSTAEFARQMQELAEAGAHPITIQQFYDHLSAGKPLPTHPILLTFDDCTLGQFTQALPILEKYRFPAVFFVQTGSVGVTTVKPHMTWEQLKEAESTGLITVESHTVTHPEDLTKISDHQLEEEMEVSKRSIEVHLGHPALFLAYPSGNCDARVALAAQQAGYLAAFTMNRGWAASPAPRYFLPRLTPKRIEDVLAVWRGQQAIEPPLPRLVAIHSSPLERGTFTGGAYPVDWIAGGSLTTETLDHRDTVGDMAQQVGAIAALNGTFFADARIASNAGGMIGPCLSSVNSTYQPSDPSDDPRLEGRPLILFSPTHCLVMPYATCFGSSQAVLQQLLPDVTDAFLAGGWIVHYGKALSPEEMRRWSSSDLNDPRHRAFVGIDAQGRYMLGATRDSISTEVLSHLLEKMGVQEAWLLDSGFSTSLIWQNHVLVSGHSEPGVPSRPVPHALFLIGNADPNAPPPPPDTPVAAGEGAATLQDALSADSTAGAANYFRRHRRRHR